MRLVEEEAAVVLVGHIRPVLWSAAIMVLGPAFIVLALVPGAPHLAFVAIGLLVTVVLDGGVILVEHADYEEQVQVLRAAAGAVVGTNV